MGEIADAIRRARRQVPGNRLLDPEPAPAGAGAMRDLQPVRPAAPVAAPERPPGASIPSVRPEPGAIVLEDGPNAEACRNLALRLRSALEQRNAKSVAIVSGERGDGKSTVACDLAIALSSLSRGRDVAIVDLDLRKPSLARYLALPPSPGVVEAILGRATLDAVCVRVDRPQIDVYPVAAPERAAHEILVQAPMAEFVAELERRYATVIFDTPPSPLVPDARLILKHVATYVPVVRSGKTRARSMRRLIGSLPEEQVLGWVVNCERQDPFGYYDYYYGEEPEGSVEHAAAARPGAPE